MINNNYQESFNQIQFLLNQLNNYVYKFNELIMQINNLMNLLNNQLNYQINKSNNSMNMMNLNQINMKDFSNKENNNKTYFTFKFESLKGNSYLSLDGNKTINDLINEYFRKINKFEYINNYDKKFTFLYNSKKINSCKDSKIDKYFILIGPHSIFVNEFFNI